MQVRLTASTRNKERSFQRKERLLWRMKQQQNLGAAKATVAFLKTQKEGG